MRYIKRFFIEVTSLVIILSFGEVFSQDDPKILPTDPNSLAIKYSVDFTEKTGEIRPINGVNLWANYSCQTIEDRRPDAEACHFSTVRLHDVPWDNNGLRLVDVHQIFGNLDADPKDPANYFFAATDDYISNIIKGGSVPIYRLGTSIEHSPNHYFTIEPKDPEHYAEICAGIVRHYNAKWANGYEWNIPYWEIWNEPDVTNNMWTGDYASYCRFYVIIAKRLRAEFPNIKIGGPALTHAGYEQIASLAKLCKSEGAPLDFVSWHCYARTPSELLEPPFKMRKILDEAGFPNAELHINEWHYFPTEWSIVHGTAGSYQDRVDAYTSPTGINGAESAAFIALTLTRWLDTPLSMSNYYAYGLERWGVNDVYGKLRPTYYALRFFGEQRNEAPNRVKTQDPCQYVSLLGSVDDSGAVKRLLVSVYKQDASQTLVIALKGVPSDGEVQVDYVDYDHDFKSEKVQYHDNKLRLNAQKSSIFLVRF